MGCLSVPFRLLGCLGLIALLAGSWLYRDRLLLEARRLTGRAPVEAVSGEPSAKALRSAESKIDSLNGWRADSVVLSAAEVAALLRSGLDPSVRRQLDSIEVELGDGDVEVEASLATARLPKELIGPMAMALREREGIQAGGPVRVVGDGRGEWEIRRITIRDFPVPRDVVPRLVSRALGNRSRGALPLRIPKGIRQIRISPSGAVLYGVKPS